MTKKWMTMQMVLAALICVVFAGLCIYETVQVLGSDVRGDARSVLLAAVCCFVAFCWFTWRFYERSVGGDACLCGRLCWLFDERLPFIGRTARWIRRKRELPR